MCLGVGLRLCAGSGEWQCVRVSLNNNCMYVAVFCGVVEIQCIDVGLISV